MYEFYSVRKPTVITTKNSRQRSHAQSSMIIKIQVTQCLEGLLVVLAGSFKALLSISWISDISLKLSPALGSNESMEGSFSLLGELEESEIYTIGTI